MQNSELVDLLRSFNSKQRKQLHKFIASPFFNENEQLLAFYEYLVRFAPEYKSSYLDRKTVFKHFFPKQSYEKNSGLGLRRLIGKLMRLIEAFIEYTELKGTGGQIPEIRALEYYSENGLERQFQKALQQIKKSKTLNYQRLSMEYYYALHQIDLKEFDFISGQNDPKRGKLLQQSIDHLDVYYFISKLQLSCILLSTRRVFRTKVDRTAIQIFLSQIEASPHLKQPFVTLYYYALSFLNDHNQEEHFQAFKSLLETQANDLPDYELRQLYMYANNYCMAKIKKGSKKYTWELFNFFQKELEQDILYVDNKILDSYFSNIVRLALRLGETDWAENFITQHEHRIISQNPEDVYLYNLASLALTQKKYDKVLELLRFAEIKDIFHRLQARLVLIKVYYETKEVELLDAALNSLKTFIYRNKIISENQQNQYKNFSNMLLQLQNTVPKDSKRIQKLEKKLSDDKEWIEIFWLRKKLEELK